MAAAKQDRPDIYRSQLANLSRMRGLYNEAAIASGNFHVQTVQTVTASQALTESIQKQKLGWRQAREELQAYRTGGRSALRELIREQTALKQAMATQFGGNVFGRNNVDMFIPRNLGTDLENAAIKYGTINQMLRSAATQTVNWGKNTQWAGRQLMVGLTVPIALVAAGAATIAAKVDQQLTRVAKVYDTTAKDMEGQEKELAALRQSSLDLGTQAANRYGAALKDTLDVEAQLAATGLQGNELFRATDQAVRLATLGEMDYQKAVDTTIALQTAYKLSGQQLTDTFNFMNAAENATSLSIQDIADSIPRAGSALAGLNVNAQQTIVMLGAMKEAGVDAAEASNALKSATTRILNVDSNKDAVKFFMDELDVNLPKVVEKANGNIYDFMIELGKVTHSLDQVKVEEGISKLFGTYQFNRASALIKNLGDAATGTANQTAKLMELMGQSASSWADTADTELRRWQDSTQGKFKRTLEGLKASLVPFGTTVLSAITPILNVVKGIIDGFNGLSPGTRHVIMLTTLLVGLVGPVLMLIGLFANLFGNMMKFGTWMYTLTNRFRLMTPQQQAAALMARNATSAFNTEAQSAAALAANVRDLTAAMEAQAVAQGAMMSRTGVMNAVVPGPNGTSQTYARQVVQHPSGYYYYGSGSVNAQGQNIGGRRISPTSADVKAYQDMEARSRGIANNAAASARSFSLMGSVVPKLAVVGLIGMSFMTSSHNAANSWMNILQIALMVSVMMPGMFTGAIAGLTGLLGRVRTGFTAAVGTIAGSFRTGIRAGVSSLGSMAGRMAGVAKSALGIWGPIGIIAGGAFLVKKIADNMNAVEAAQKKVNESAKGWAEIMGYTYSPGTFTDNNGNTKITSTLAAHSKQVDELKEKLPDLVKQLQAAATESDNFGRVFDLAMQEALKGLTTGATPEQALQQFQVALQAAGLSAVQIEQLTIRYRNVKLENIDDVKNQIMGQVQRILEDVPDSTDAMNGSWLRNFMGGNLDSDVRATGERAGRIFAQGFSNEADPNKRKEMLGDFQTNLDKTFDPIWDRIYKRADPKLKEQFRKLGIDSMQELLQAVAEQGPDGEIFKGLDDNAKSSLKSYQEFFQVVLQSLVDAGVISQKNMDEIFNPHGWANLDGDIRNVSGDLNTLARIMGLNQQGFISVQDASGQYDAQIEHLTETHHILTEAQRLAILNTYRHKAGLDDAKTSSQGFKTETEAAAAAVTQLGGALRVTADDLSNAQKSAMSGAWGDILNEAQRQFEDVRKKRIDAIKHQYDVIDAGFTAEEKRQQQSFDAQEKAQKTFYDQQEKALKTAQDAETKSAQQYWESREKAAKAAQDAEQKSYEVRIENIQDQKKASQEAADAQKKIIQDEIEALRKQDDVRQRVFDAEMKRIERMTAMANSNIDFNVALNSGNLDEAARLAVSISSQQSQWNLQDSQDSLEQESKDRQDSLQNEIDIIDEREKARQDAFDAEIDRLQKEKEARKDAYDEQIQQIQDARDAALEALKARQDAETEALAQQKQRDQEALASSRQTSQDSLDAKRQANDAARDNAVQDAEDALDADKRSLEQRLRALQQFVPTNEAELRQHIQDVQNMYADYGVNLQMQGNAWGTYIGNSLRYNVDSAAVALQTQIGWQQVAANISSQIGAGTGMSLEQVKQFLMTGTFPPGSQNASPPYTGSTSAPRIAPVVGSTYRPTNGGTNVARAFYAGGYTGDGGKFEPAGIVHRGEFVFPKEAVKRLGADNLGALAGLPGYDAGGLVGGPLANPIAALVGMQLAGIGDTTFFAVQEEKRRKEAMEAAQSEGGTGPDGGYSGSGMTWHALDNIRRQLFPASVLTSAYRPGANDWHGQGDAIDIGVGGNLQSGLMPIAAKLAALYPDATELIHNPNGSIKNGRNVPPSFWGSATWAQHANHVHWAMTPAALASHRGVSLAGLGAGPVAAGTNQQIVQNIAASMFGWTGAEWAALYQLVMHESGFKNTAQNPISTAYGMFQFLNSTWGGTGIAKTSDPTQQAIAGLRYIRSSYGDPIRAWSFWQGHHWYDEGGFLPPGMTMAMNASGKPEPVFTADQWDILQRSLANSTLMYENLSRQAALVPAGGAAVASGEKCEYNITIDLRGALVKEELDIESAVYRAIDKREARNGRRRVIG